MGFGGLWRAKFISPAVISLRAMRPGLGEIVAFTYGSCTTEVSRSIVRLGRVKRNLESENVVEPKQPERRQADQSIQTLPARTLESCHDPGDDASTVPPGIPSAPNRGELNTETHSLDPGAATQQGTVATSSNYKTDYAGVGAGGVSGVKWF